MAVPNATEYATTSDNSSSEYIEHIDTGGDGNFYDDDYGDYGDYAETIYPLNTLWNKRVFPLSGIVALVLVSVWVILVATGVLTEQHRRRVRRCQIIVNFSVWDCIFSFALNLPLINSSLFSSRRACLGIESIRLVLTPVGPSILATLWIAYLAHRAQNKVSSKRVTCLLLVIPWILWTAIMLPLLLTTEGKPLFEDDHCDSGRKNKFYIIISIIGCVVPVVLMLLLLFGEIVVSCSTKRSSTNRRKPEKTLSVISDVLVTLLFVASAWPWQLYNLLYRICIYFEDNQIVTGLFNNMCSYEKAAQSKFDYSSVFLVLTTIGMPVAQMMWFLSRDIRRSIFRTIRFRCLCRKVPRRDTYKESLGQSVRLNEVNSN